MTEKNFFTSLFYLIVISIITFIFWMLHLEGIGFPIYVGIIFVLLIFVKNSIYVIPFLLNILFMISQTSWDTESIPMYLYLGPAVVLIGLIIHSVRFKVKIFKGKFFLGLLILGIAMITSTIINADSYDMNFFFIILGTTLLVFLYGFFANSIEGDNLLYLIKIFVIIGVMIAFQVFYYYIDYYLQFGEITTALQHKTIDLGWGISNFVATYLIMFISAIVFFVKKYKLHLFWIILMLFEIIMLIFTLSRAGIIAFSITFILLILFMFIKYDHKLNLLLNLSLGALIFSIIGYFAKEYFLTIWQRLEMLRLDDSGRIELWYEARDVFMANPIFGGGFFARSTSTLSNELRMFHNTILHTLACFGIIGGIGLLVQLISILRIFLYKLTQEKAILLIALIGANIHGMVDNVYFMPQYMIIMFIVIAVVEKANEIDKLRKELTIR